MTKFLSVVMIVLVAGLAYFWFIRGPNVLWGGPSRAEISAATRAALAGPPGATTEADIAIISPRGLCRKGEDGSFACVVAISGGDATDSAVVVLKREPDGNWIAVE